MSSPLDPVSMPARVEPTAPARRVERERQKRDDRGRREPDERPEDEDEGEEDGGLHIDVLA